MNYYPRYPSHYLAATVDLTMEQDGAYTRLLDWYYSRECAIPDNKRYVIGRAIVRKERAAIDYVLATFFNKDLALGVWTHDRVESELGKAAPKIEAARENGKRGGRPSKKEPSGFPENNPVGFSDITHEEPTAKAPQSPIPSKEQKKEISPPTGVEGTLPKTNSHDLAGEILAKPDRKDVPFAKIVELYHSALPMLPAVEKLTDKRRGYIRQRWAEDLPTLDAWRNYFADVAKSRFLTGQTQGINSRPPFIANLEWLCNPSNFTKVAEGNYHR